MALKKVALAIKRLFAGKPGIAQAAPPVHSEVAQETAASFNSRLADILKSKKQAAAGRLQVISLEKIRDLIPDNSEAFAKKVHDEIMKVISRRLGPDDTFMQTSPNSYIILFDKLDKEDAELQCVLIVQEVLRSLFEDRKLDDKVDIRTVTMDIDGKIGIECVDLLEVIDRLMETKATAVAAIPVPAPSSPKQDSTTAVPPQNSMKEASIANYLSDAAKLLPDNLEFSYLPFWDVKRKVISTYACLVTNDKGTGYGVLGPHPDSRLIAALDFLAFGRALHELKKLNESGKRLLVYCPVHERTLSNQLSWRAYQALCSRIASVIPNQDMVFEIFGVDENTDKKELVISMAKIMKYGRHIIMRTPPAVPRLVLPEKGRPLHLCVNFADFKGSEKRKMKHMDEYVLEARKYGVGAMIYGLQSLSQTTAAIGSGFSCINGDAIHPTVSSPDLIFHFEIKNLLDHLKMPPE